MPGTFMYSIQSAQRDGDIFASTLSNDMVIHTLHDPAQRIHIGHGQGDTTLPAMVVRGADRSVEIQRLLVGYSDADASDRIPSDASLAYVKNTLGNGSTLAGAVWETVLEGEATVEAMHIDHTNRVTVAGGGGGSAQATLVHGDTGEVALSLHAPAFVAQYDARAHLLWAVPFQLSDPNASIRVHDTRADGARVAVVGAFSGGALHVYEATRLDAPTQSLSADPSRSATGFLVVYSAEAPYTLLLAQTLSIDALDTPCSMALDASAAYVSSTEQGFAFLTRFPFAPTGTVTRVFAEQMGGRVHWASASDTVVVATQQTAPRTVHLYALSPQDFSTQWSKSIQSPLSSLAPPLARLELGLDNHLYVMDRTDAAMHVDGIPIQPVLEDTWLAKISMTGHTQWVGHLSGSSSQAGVSLAVNKVGSVYVSGQFTGALRAYDATRAAVSPDAFTELSPAAGQEEGFVVKYDRRGKVLQTLRALGVEAGSTRVGADVLGRLVLSAKSAQGGGVQVQDDQGRILYASVPRASSPSAWLMALEYDSIYRLPTLEQGRDDGFEQSIVNVSPRPCTLEVIDQEDAVHDVQVLDRFVMYGSIDRPIKTSFTWYDGAWRPAVRDFVTDQNIRILSAQVAEQIAVGSNLQAAPEGALQASSDVLAAAGHVQTPWLYTSALQAMPEKGDLVTTALVLGDAGTLQLADGASLSTSAQTVQVITAGAPRMTVDAAGGVGIGTTGPQAGTQLHVHGRGVAPARIAWTQSNTDDAMTMTYDQGQGRWLNAAAEGALHMGTRANPDAVTIDVAGTVHVSGLPEIGDALVVQSGALRVTGDGRVGMGTTDPAALVHVLRDPAVALGLTDALRVDTSANDHVLRIDAATGALEMLAGCNQFLVDAATGTLEMRSGSGSNQFRVEDGSTMRIRHAHEAVAALEVVDVVTAGQATSAFAVRAAGRAGVGTAEPDAHWHVHDPLSSGAQVHVTHAGSTAGGFRVSHCNNDAFLANDEPGGRIELRTQGASGLRVLPTGSVYRVEVDGSLRVNSNLAVDGGMVVKGDDYFIQTERLTIKSHMPVINRTIDPATQATRTDYAGFEIQRAAGSGHNYTVAFEEATGTLRSGSNVWRALAHRQDSFSNAAIPYWDKAQERLTFDPSIVVVEGRVGIQTAAPALGKALHVRGDTRLGNSPGDGVHEQLGTLTVTANRTGLTALVVNQQGTGRLLDVQDGGVTEVTVVDGGRVGVGTMTPQARLHVTRRTDSLNLNEDVVRFADEATPVVVDALGNMAIGHAAPDAKLHVLFDAARPTSYAMKFDSFPDDPMPTIIDADGRVGIRTDQVSDRSLEVYGTGMAIKDITRSNAFYAYNENTADFHLDFAHRTIDGLRSARVAFVGNKDALQAGIGVYTADPNTGALVKRMFVDNSPQGNVGIGRLDDLANARLHVDGRVLVENGDTQVSHGQILADGELTTPENPARRVRASPSYAFVENPNMGLYRPADNEMGFVTRGIERVRIDEAGNVGIGTMDPQSDFHLHEDTRNWFDLQITNRNIGPGASNGTLITQSNVDLTINNQEPTGFMRFSTSNTERIRIVADGNVGVGTTAPQVDLHLHEDTKDTFDLQITNSITAAGEGEGTLISQSGNNLLINNREITGYMAFSTSNTERVRIQWDGNVGVGTISPQKDLHLHEDTKDTFDLQITNNDTGAGVNDGTLVSQSRSNLMINNRESGFMAFHTSGEERVRIVADGNVGIGTINPSAKLHVLQTGTADAFRIDDVLNDTTPFIVNANGMVGIGTATNQLSSLTYIYQEGARLDGIESQTHHLQMRGLYGSFLFMGIDDLNEVGYIQSGKAGIGKRSLLLNPQGGNVGIGTADPVQLLHVHGTITSQAVRVAGYNMYQNLGVFNIDHYSENYAGGDVTSKILVLDATGNLTTKGAVYAADGTAALPAYTFSADSNTGVWRPGNDVFAVSTAGTERLRVDATGNVGIGTASPGSKLHVEGNIMISDDSSSTENQNAIRELVLKNGFIGNLGNVANGVSRYGRSFHISSGTLTGAYWGGYPKVYGGDLSLYGGSIDLNGNNGTAYVEGYGGSVKIFPGYAFVSQSNVGNSRKVESGQFIVYTANTNGASVDTGYTESLRVNNLGNVGIGTASPGNKLHVHIGNIALSGANSFVGTTTNHALILRTNDTERVNITSAGNVGIGTASPGNKLHVHSGNIALSGADSFVGTTTNHALILTTNNTERVRITSGGNVGIGTTNPGSYELNVTGTIAASTDVVVTSDRRVKAMLQPIEKALDKVCTLTGYTFERTTPSGEEDPQRRYMGLIAQEVQDIAPEAVREDTSSGLLSLSYGDLVGLVVEAIKDLRQEVQALRSLVVPNS